MLFNSPIFLLFFFPALLTAYALMRSIRARNSVLLSGSILFYLWGEAEQAWALGLLIALGYFGAKSFAATQQERLRRIKLIFWIILAIAPLIYFKYIAFFAVIFDKMTGADVAAAHWKLALPLGISFFTFQCISYMIDVHRRQVRPAKNLSEFALYITLFPHLIAGPIVRFKQIRRSLNARPFTLFQINRGLRIFTAGFASKVLIANPLGTSADKIFSTVASHLDAGQAWLGALLFSFQIYFDFQGYSLMAIGLAAVFGFKFPINFNDPYQANGIRDFWQRWHISLSTWLRDYIYRPLSARFTNDKFTPLAILLTFLISGLWHGANWNFLIWGLYHGVCRVCELHHGYRKIVTMPVFGRIWTFLLIMFGWVIFRIQDLSALKNYLCIMLDMRPAPSPALATTYLYHELLPPDLVLTGLVASALCFVPAASRLAAKIIFSEGHLYRTQSFCVVITLILSVSFMSAQTFNPFIYFRF